MNSRNFVSHCIFYSNKDIIKQHTTKNLNIEPLTRMWVFIQFIEFLMDFLVPTIPKQFRGLVPVCTTFQNMKPVATLSKTKWFFLRWCYYILSKNSTIKLKSQNKNCYALQSSSVNLIIQLFPSEHSLKVAHIASY